MIHIQEEVYYTPKEVANLLNVSETRIRQLRLMGRLSGLKAGPRKFYYKEKDIQSYIEGKNGK